MAILSEFDRLKESRWITKEALFKGHEELGWIARARAAKTTERMMERQLEVYEVGDGWPVEANTLVCWPLVT